MSSLVLESRTSNIVEYKFSKIIMPAERHYMLSDNQRIQLMLSVHAFSYIGIVLEGESELRAIRVFVESIDDQKAIKELETILEVGNGVLTGLIEKATHSKALKAEKNDLKVELNVSAPDIKREINKDDSMVSGMKYYELTELSHSLLNDAIAAYSNIIHRAKFRKEPLADGLSFEELEKNIILAQNILRQSDNFSSIDEMQLIIKNYSPLVKELYRA